MARTTTLAAMRTSIQVEGAYENSVDISTTVLNEYINRSTVEVWEILRKKRDDRLVKAPLLIYSAIGVDTVQLPPDFYELRKLEIADPSSRTGWTRLRKIDLDVTHLYATLFGKRYRYRLQGESIYLVPTPQAVETLRLWYLPCAPVLVNDSDTFDGVNGYEELVFQLVMRKCKVRQEQDTSEADREIARLEARINSAADGRDAEPFFLNPHGAMPRGLGNDDDDLWGWW